MLHSSRDVGMCPNLMACSKVNYGTCSRCGQVGKSHFGPEAGASRPATRSEETERAALRQKYFKSEFRRRPQAVRGQGKLI